MQIATDRLQLITFFDLGTVRDKHPAGQTTTEHCELRNFLRFNPCGGVAEDFDCLV